MSKKLTVYQRLNNLLGPEGIRNNQRQANKYNISNDEIIRTKDKGEYKAAMQQAQQTKYLKSQWNKVDGELYQNAIHYETTRVGSYADFESMEFYPEISAALDVMMEESTTANDKGKILNVYSESDRVKDILNDLFMNRMDIHTNLPMWTRNTPIREDSIIPLLNGEEITIKELSERVKHSNGEDIWTYSVQDGTSKILPGKIIWCDLTRRDSELIRVTLDDGTHIDTTPDHEYVLRNGDMVRADELKFNDSLMPFYTTTSKEANGKLKGYEKVFNPYSNRYRYTHRIVARECVTDFQTENSTDEKYLTHHVDFNKKNNSPENLLRMSFGEHAVLHEESSKILEQYRSLPEVVEKRMQGIDRYLRSDERRERLSQEMKGVYPTYFEEYNNSELHKEHNKIRSNAMANYWANEDYRKEVSSKMSLTLSNECLNLIKKIISHNGFQSKNKLAETLKNNNSFMELFKKANSEIKRDVNKSMNRNTLEQLIVRATGKDYYDFILSVDESLVNDKSFKKNRAISKGKVINHKVVSVELLEETSDVYCMEVVGPNGEGDRHNFPVCSKDSEGNHTRNGVFLSNCKYGDNFLHLNIDDKRGITGVKQLPNFEIERREGDLYGILNRKASDEEVSEVQKTKFLWKGKDIVFNSWQIAHFRLLGDDRRLPYGTSVLEKARRIWKQLVLSEDAMLVYRVTRAPERRVYKVYVGNIDDADVGQYVDQIANKFKRSPITDPKTGQIDLRYNQLAIDQDIFVPVREEGAATPIDTLPGASNLDQIADIEYLQRKLFTALRVPKPFLGFEDTAGEGKNLALQDIRFSRTINRIQQSMIQELNKIAIIHLYLLGFEDELSNFTITLNNPSTQADMLKLDHEEQKINLYKNAVADAGNGFGAMSMTRAKKDILGWSDDEIRQDLIEQRMEKAAATELENTPNVIKHTGIFDKVDRLYGDMEAAKEGGQVADNPEEGGPAAGGGGFGGGGGGADLDFGDTGLEDEMPDDAGLDGGGMGGDMGGDLGGMDDDLGGMDDEMGMDDSESGMDDLGGDEPDSTQESTKKKGSLLTESIKPKTKLTPKRSNVDILINNIKKDDNKLNESVKLYDKNFKINQGVQNMINEIDKKLKK